MSEIKDKQFAKCLFKAWKTGNKTAKYYVHTRPAADPQYFTIDPEKQKEMEEMLKKEKNVISVYQPKNRVEEEIKPFRLKMEDVYGDDNQKSTILTYIGELAREDNKKDEAKDIIVELLNATELYRTDLIQKLKNDYDIGNTKTKEALKDLEDEKIISSKKDGKKDIYFLRSIPSSSITAVF
jgi:hypothetical protein